GPDLPDEQAEPPDAADDADRGNPA
ncbi:MAG: hypothetical protein QOJ68_3468, partial [Blastococcus sp.]|nr:hypothetical protein [Blastococcus sp.]